MTQKNAQRKDAANEEPKKQLKIWLTKPEHTVVSTAASMLQMTISDYMKKAVIDRALVDTEEFTKIVNELRREKN